MSSEIRVPRLAESISEAVLVEWLKPDGAAVATDEPVAVLETDKAAVEIAASADGMLRHGRAIGDRVVVGDVLGRVEAGAPAAVPAAGGSSSGAQPAAPRPAAGTPARPAGTSAPATAGTATRPAGPAPAPGSKAAVAAKPDAASVETAAKPDAKPDAAPGAAPRREPRVMRPAPIPTAERQAMRLPSDFAAADAPADGAEAGPDVARDRAPASRPVEAPAEVAARTREGPSAAPSPVPNEALEERAVPMTRIRQRIAERLVRSQQTTATLTTFNEIDMTAVSGLRARFREEFERRHGVRLGLMGLFTRATVAALREVPELNAEIRGTDVVYRDHVHMGVAVQTEKGLVVPVVRRADRLSLAEVEREIVRLAERARAGVLTLDELSGGTFTISNGGVYGSLLSTPILNPPQSGILGMHKIEKRPIALNDQVVIRPMMYVALSYDHRIVDGEQAVRFLVRVKERLEDPERLLLDV